MPISRVTRYQSGNQIFILRFLIKFSRNFKSKFFNRQRLTNFFNSTTANISNWITTTYERELKVYDCGEGLIRNVCENKIYNPRMARRRLRCEQIFELYGKSPSKPDVYDASSRGYVFGSLGSAAFVCVDESSKESNTWRRMKQRTGEKVTETTSGDRNFIFSAGEPCSKDYLVRISEWILRNDDQSHPAQ